MSQVLAKTVLRLKRSWMRFWMRRSGLGSGGRLAMRFAKWSVPHYKSSCELAEFGASGYVAASATIEHAQLELTKGVFLGDRTTVYQSTDGGAISLKKGVRLYSDSILETGEQGVITIGQETHIQPRCSLSAYKGSIHIGERVEIAPNCAFYPYNHQMKPGKPIREQPLTSSGDIVVEDDAWLGVGVILLENVRIGAGAVIGAGSVVTTDIPANAIAVGSPAKVVGKRQDL